MGMETYPPISGLPFPDLSKVAHVLDHYSPALRRQADVAIEVLHAYVSNVKMTRSEPYCSWGDHRKIGRFLFHFIVERSIDCNEFKILKIELDEPDPKDLGYFSIFRNGTLLRVPVVDGDRIPSAIIRDTFTNLIDLPDEGKYVDFWHLQLHSLIELLICLVAGRRDLFRLAGMTSLFIIPLPSARMLSDLDDEESFLERHSSLLRFLGRNMHCGIDVRAHYRIDDELLDADIIALIASRIEKRICSEWDNRASLNRSLAIWSDDPEFLMSALSHAFLPERSSFDQRNVLILLHGILEELSEMRLMTKDAKVFRRRLDLFESCLANGYRGMLHPGAAPD